MTLTRFALSISLCAITLCSGASVYAVPGAASSVSEAGMVKDMSLLEHRFFSRQFANDPTEKRLERLELLVFGAAQDGALAARWGKLNQAIVSRSQTPIAKSLHESHDGAAGSGDAATGKDGSTKEGVISKDAGASTAPKSSTQYPVLNTLEWKALKQTFPKETLDARLGRIEKKLFGQDAPGMAYIDRVDRLKKTLGVGMVAAAPSGPTGPAPRAHGRGQSYGFNMPDGMYGGGLGGGLGDAMPGFGGMPGMGGMPGFSMNFGGGAMNGAFNKMFADLNRQMAEAERLGPGVWSLDPATGNWIDQSTGKKMKPGEPGAPKGFFQAPRANPVAPRVVPRRQANPFNFGGGDNNMNELPPYADPNSI